MTNNLPKRNDIEGKYKWQLTDLIGDEGGVWQAYYDDILALCEHLLSLQGQLKESAQTLYDCLDTRDRLEMKFSRLYAFSFMRLHLDTKDSISQEATEKKSTPYKSM